MSLSGDMESLNLIMKWGYGHTAQSIGLRAQRAQSVGKNTIKEKRFKGNTTRNEKHIK